MCTLLLNNIELMQKFNPFLALDALRSGQSAKADDNEILALIESDRHRTTREIEEILGINQLTVSRRLRQLGMG